MTKPPPVALADFGSFHVGGRAIAVAGRPTREVALSRGLASFAYDPNGAFWIEQAYVQYFVPVRLRQRTPLLLVHGGGMTGACWETTPDGRPGWAQILLGAGFAVYVIDNVERGRAGFCAIDGTWPDAPLMRSAAEAWRLFRFGRAEDFAQRRPYPGQQFPIAAFDDLLRQMVPRWTSTSVAQQAALATAIRRIGPCVLIAHSQGGGLAFDAANACGGLVRGCVALEPHGGPAAFAPPAVAGVPCLLVLGDYLDDTAFWRDLAAKARDTLVAWRNAEGTAELLDLPSTGIRGNSHMLMMDANSAALCEAIVDWIDRQRALGRFA